MGDLYIDDDDDNSNEFVCRLADHEYDAMQAFEKNQILMGIDLEDPDET